MTCDAPSFVCCWAKTDAAVSNSAIPTACAFMVPPPSAMLRAPAMPVKRGARADRIIPRDATAIALALARGGHGERPGVPCRGRPAGGGGLAGPRAGGLRLAYPAAAGA